MPSVTAIEAERSEVDALLQSGLFHRAPNLANFLRYVCDRHFLGQTDAIKEYCIAVEALGRPPDFDQKKDAIVRVEAHRLRRRLAEYYATDGASHAIHIEIPPGQYAPKFVAQIAAPPPPPLDSSSHLTSTINVPTLAPAAKHHPALLTALLLSILGALLMLTAFFLRHPSRESYLGNSTDPIPSEFRFLAGYQGAPFLDQQGRTWQPDSYFDGGVSVSLPPVHSFSGVPDPNLIRSRREGNFRYDVPVRPGVYELRLYFVETNDDAPEAPYNRLFNVYLNGNLALGPFSPGPAAGSPNRLYVRVFNDVAPAKDGKIHLRFESLSGKPIVNAVEILSSSPGRVRPVRIVAAKASVTDLNGSIWLSDEYFSGGVLVERRDSIQDPSLKMLFTGEHYGNFSYHIPVPPGRYRLRLYFAETYFGSKLPYAGDITPANARIFHVYIGGQTLLHNFNVVQEAGGPNKAVTRSFDNIEPNAQGEIVLQFVPERNWAEVNAIEVTQME